MLPASPTSASCRAAHARLGVFARALIVLFALLMASMLVPQTAFAQQRSGVALSMGASTMGPSAGVHIRAMETLRVPLTGNVDGYTLTYRLADSKDSYQTVPNTSSIGFFGVEGPFDLTERAFIPASCFSTVASGGLEKIPRLRFAPDSRRDDFTPNRLLDSALRGTLPSPTRRMRRAPLTMRSSACTTY